MAADSLKGLQSVSSPVKVIREGRRYCVDQPDGIAHPVDSPRAQRCDQHREQRHRWSDANGKRRKAGKPLLDWVPEPLSPSRRREALDLIADRSAGDIRRVADNIDQAITEIESKIRLRPESDAYRVLALNLARLKAQHENLTYIADRMGAPRT